VAPEVPELMRRHVNADVTRDDADDLHCKRRLALTIASLFHKQRAIHVSAKERQYVPAIPSKPADHLVWDLTHNVLSLGLGVSGGNVKEQLTPWALAH
jgi:hypothetical protein